MQLTFEYKSHSLSVLGHYIQNDELNVSMFVFWAVTPC